VEEVAYFCRVVADAGEEIDAKKLEKQIAKDSIPFKQAASQAVDIALSGRMATSGLMTNIDGSLAVAHAITTHEVNDSDIDWFTAVDDLVQEEKAQHTVGDTEEGKGEQGSGHLDTQEFSSGVFYRYASLNIGQLQKNMGSASREQALDVAAHVLHMLATVVPSAKQQTFAAHNVADLAMVSFSDLPVSLANAFENPVRQKGEGYIKPSLESLNTYWSRIHRGYGLNEKCAEFTLSDELTMPDDIKVLQSLELLKHWVRQGGE
jgi:CRISPR system Cascade subunit CasC